jgi:hypothetical protein
VPLLALVVGVLVAAVASALGATANLNLPFTTNQLPVEEGNLVDWGVGVGIASVVAMFLGGALGGTMGVRWHSKLERSVAEEQTERQVDLRDDAAPTRPADTGTSSSTTATR